MPVKIRLMRIGAKKRPFFRVVAVDEQKKRTGAYLELLGTYNPLTEPKEIILKQDRIDEWLKKGAQPSDGFLRITGAAPQRPPRKPKKEAKAAPTEAPASQAKAAEEIPSAEVDQQVSDSAEPAGQQTSEPEKQQEATPEDIDTQESGPTDQAEADETPTPAETPADAPVESETSLKEAKPAESAQEAAEVLAPEAEIKEEEPK